MVGKACKSIGIVTWHRCHNYGGSLQAYALQYFLKEKCQGYKPEHINYWEGLQGVYSSIGEHMLYTGRKDRLAYAGAGWARIRNQKAVFLRKNAFESFIKEALIVSDTEYCTPKDLLENPPEYDIYMSGGDQIWNFRYRSRHALKNFLWFTRSPNKLAYGSGMCDFDAHRIPLHILPMLRDYRKIMVREREGAETLKKYLMRNDIEHVLDPTLLLQPDDYAGIQTDSALSAPYVFAYVFDHLDGDYRKTVKLLKDMAKRLGMKVVLISNSAPVFGKHITTCLEAGPREWLRLIANAELVLTNSFHGTAMSLVYNKPFYVLRADLRKTNLLNSVGIRNRFITPRDSVRDLTAYDMDFSKANDLLRKERERCSRLLKDALASCE